MMSYTDWMHWRNESEKPFIWVTGSPRSGTTWLCSLLNYVETFGCLDEGLNQPFFGNYDRGMESVNWKSFLDATRDEIRIQDMSKRGESIDYVMIKQPYPVHDSFIKSFMTSDNCKIIVIHRHPLDVLLSMHHRSEIRDPSWPSLFRDDYIKVRNYLETFSFFWNFRINKCMYVKYEELILNQKVIFDRICQFICGDEQVPKMLSLPKPSSRYVDLRMGSVNHLNRRQYPHKVEEYNKLISAFLSEPMIYYGYSL